MESFGKFNRSALKKDARREIAGNTFNYLFPLLVVVFITAVLNIPIYILSGNGFYAGSVLSIVTTLLLVPLSVGSNLFFILSSREHKPVKMDVLFNAYKKPYVFWEQLKAYIVTGLYIVLGLLLLIIPGIYLALKYSFVFYIMADEPEITYKEAMQKSAQIAAGRYGEIFCFFLSFFFWWCLCIITLGIATLYVAPYQAYATAKYYDALTTVVFPKGPDGLDGPYDRKTADYDPYGFSEKTPH